MQNLNGNNVLSGETNRKLIAKETSKMNYRDMQKKTLFILSALLIFCQLTAAFSIIPTTYSYAAGDSLKVEFYNQVVSPTTTSVSPCFKITNTGSSTINLSDLKLRYYYSVDIMDSQTFYCDWSSIGSTNITGTFINMIDRVPTADYYLEIGFAPTAGVIAPGGVVEIKGRFNKAGWTNYTQTNDYSFNSTASNYVQWDMVTAYIKDALVWGTPPQDPNPTPIPTPTSTPTPTPTANYFYEDNFEDSIDDGWKRASGSWSVVSDGSKVYKNQTNTGVSYSVIDRMYAGDSTMEVKFKVNSWGTSSDKAVGILSRIQDNRSSSEAGYYMFVVDSGKLYIKKKAYLSSNVTVVKSVSQTISTGTWYTLKAEVSGNTLKLYLNGTLKLTATDESFSSGKFGVYSEGAIASFDNVKITENDENRFLVIVGSSLYNTGLIDASLTTYQQDIANEGWANTLIKVSSISGVTSDYDITDCQSLKSVIRDYYEKGYMGFVIVGSYPDIPVAYWRPHSGDDRKLITDYYYADIVGYVDSDNDGIKELVYDWFDLDGDGIFEAYKKNADGSETPLMTEAEMIYGRIDAAGITSDIIEQAQLTNAYFSKLSLFRVYGSNMTEEEYNSAFSFLDSDWRNWKYSSYDNSSRYNVLKAAFKNLKFVADDVATTVEKLEKELRNGYYFAEVITHGESDWIQIHEYPNGIDGYRYYNNDFNADKLLSMGYTVPRAHYIHSYGCNTSQYMDPMYGSNESPKVIPNMGATYLFRSYYTMNVTGVCASVWSNLDEQYFRDLSSMSIGEAFKDWANRWYSSHLCSDVPPYVLLGDPTLKHFIETPSNKCPCITNNFNGLKAKAGQLFTLNLNVIDADSPNSSINVVVPVMPEGATYNSSLRRISWTPSLDQKGICNFTVKATDSSGNVFTEDFTVYVE